MTENEILDVALASPIPQLYKKKQIQEQHLPVVHMTWWSVPKKRKKYRGGAVICKFPRGCTSG